ncbi:MAG: hypothetical protein DMF65_07295 [Acidobacteria bacterium]|nr:MAG: hypothetical protein DMF65_07295 [Acidobacteriota bacterium]
MRNRASTHLLLLLLIVGFEIVGYVAVYDSALLRGYEPSVVGAVRDLLLYVPLIFLLFWLSRVMRFRGNWTLFTSAVLLFSIGLLVQYRLYSDPEYGSGSKAEARAEKTQVQRLRFINQFYGADKKQAMGLDPTTAQPSATPEIFKRSEASVGRALTSSFTWIPLFAFFAMALSYWLCVEDKYLDWMQRQSFIIVLATLVPLFGAVVWSRAGKFGGNMTPWEPSKIPFLVGFAGILTAHYRELARTYWGMPRARNVIPLLVMGVIPFIPFFALKDFGQMLVFSGAYATLYLVAVRRWPQLLVFVGSLALVVVILVVGALPPDVQEKVPTLTTLATPVRAVLPTRIKQRFHLWLDGFDPPPTDADWWKKDYEEELSNPKNARMREMAAESPAMQKTVNIDVWFDRIAFQPSQATFGIVAGRVTGRGLGLGFSEVIPVSDSDFIYAAISEELGLTGGAVVILALIVLVSAGFRTSIEARDMFTKLCSAGLTAFIGFQAIVNIGGETRALPMTGITLPFVSHGGFSLITSFAMLGMLLAFSHRNAADAVAPSRAAVAPLPREEEEIRVPEAVQ